ncbi:MAG TPA: hypothetical protein VEV41_09895 [Terriglobales bacterium]|nr:hypothetical protein [Terriglobales bacterium]
MRPNEPALHQGMAEIYRLTSHPDQPTAEEREAERLSKNVGKPQ